MIHLSRTILLRQEVLNYDGLESSNPRRPSPAPAHSGILDVQQDEALFLPQHKYVNQQSPSIYGLRPDPKV